MRSTTILIGLLLCFISPWIIATSYFYYFQRANARPEPSLSCGVLITTGTQLSNQPQINNNWTLLYLPPNKNLLQERFLLWKEQGQIFPSFLKKQNLTIEFSKENQLDSLAHSSLQRSLSWDINQEGAVILIDPNGFVAIAFSYNEPPKQAFFTVKKLVST